MAMDKYTRSHLLRKRVQDFKAIRVIPGCFMGHEYVGAHVRQPVNNVWVN